MFYTQLTTMLKEVPGWLLSQPFGKPTLTILKHRAALGDALMLSPLVRSVKKYLPDLRIALATKHPECFEHNPYVDENRGWHVVRTALTTQVCYHMENSRHEHYVEEQWLQLWDFLCAKNLLTGPVQPMAGRHPELFLTHQEKAAARELLQRHFESKRPLVVLVSDGKLKPTHNREWGYENYVEVARALAPQACLLQLSGTRILEFEANGGTQQVFNLRVPVRQAAAILAHAQCLLTQEGGLMHLARAVDCPSVVIYGGSLLPIHSGYDRMVNLYSQPECSPCRALRQNCPHLKCMEPLTPRRIVAEIANLLVAGGFAIDHETMLQEVPDHWKKPAFLGS